MNKYEIMYIINPECKDIKALQEKMHNILKQTGKVESVTDWGLRDLAYPINHKNKAYYTILKVAVNKETINEFKRVAKIEQDIYRHLIINLDTEQNYSDKMIADLKLNTNENDERPSRYSGERRQRPYVPRETYKKTENK
ncbi:30S ribosomal protein S6 [Spiroplasma endosymbiont of 'Nebria riversi']|uniref:30S ribosomal protein S6 n=1 Tax=Spiroplasma endosymbiont of 'Nebria riversi' TaxID=2792084 RepID=UPI001C04D7D0|nr:30S ribosomal protein S6 [Spiroplasma endosymbiont of 'Nebria riversi']